MTDKLLCPFCKQELRCDNTWNEVYMCRNPNCNHLLGYGTKDLWRALIDTKKKLDMANAEMDYIKEQIEKDKVFNQIKNKEQQ